MWLVMVGWEERSFSARSLTREGPFSSSRASSRVAARLSGSSSLGTHRMIRAQVVTRSRASSGSSCSTRDSLFGLGPARGSATHRGENQGGQLLVGGRVAEPGGQLDLAGGDPVHGR